MHVAAEKGHCKIVEYLVGTGLDIDVQNGGSVSINHVTLPNDSRKICIADLNLKKEIVSIQALKLIVPKSVENMSMGKWLFIKGCGPNIRSRDVYMPTSHPVSLALVSYIQMQ